jgi:hypothetical protein
MHRDDGCYPLGQPGRSGRQGLSHRPNPGLSGSNTSDSRLGLTRLQCSCFGTLSGRRLYTPQVTQVALRPAEDSSAVEWASRARRLHNVRRAVEWAVYAILGATLLAYALLGNFTRYVQDDFLSALDDRAHGFWAAQVLTYQRHDGHFLGTALQDAGGMLSVAFARILPGILIAVWVALLSLALRYLAPAAGRLGRLLIGAGIVYTTLRITPNPFLSLYWMTASLAYVVPLLFAALLVWLLSRPPGHGRSRVVVMAAACLVAFLAGGLAEEYTAAQTVALTLAAAVALSRQSSAWRQRFPVIAVALLGSIAGLCVMAAAPGNAIRSAAIERLVGPRPSLLLMPRFTFPEMVHFLHVLIGTHWRGLLAMAVLAAFVGARSGPVAKFAIRTAVIAVLIATLGALVVVFSAMTPAALEQAQPPHDYAQIVLVYICVCSIATLGWVAGRLGRGVADRVWPRTGLIERARGTLAATAALVAGAVVVTGPIGTLVTMRHDLPAIQAYAMTKDNQATIAEAAHAAGRTSAVVPPIANSENIGLFSHTDTAELQRDPRFWLNLDVATYYDLIAIATSPPPPAHQ